MPKISPIEEIAISLPPPPRATMCFATSRKVRNTPSRSTRVTWRHSSSDSSSVAFTRPKPALATQMSMRPSAFTVSATARASCASSATSQGRASARAPRPSSSFTAASLLAASRAQTAIAAPACARPRAMPSPIPPLPPVTTATRPLRSNIEAPFALLMTAGHYPKERTMEALEALETARAMRYLKPDPVPEELLRRLVWGATRASSPGNSQGWEFVVVRERATKERLGAAVRERMGRGIRAMPTDDDMQRRMLTGAGHLLEHFADVPAWIVICGRKVYPPQAPSEAMVWSTVYPAGQNLIVAARALGLGATFTTFHLAAEKEFRETLGIPAERVPRRVGRRRLPGAEARAGESEADRGRAALGALVTEPASDAERSVGRT